VVSGETADDGLYIPIFDQVRQTLQTLGLLWVGDCKMSNPCPHPSPPALLPDALTRVGKVPELIQQWIAEALAGNAPLLEVCHCQPENNPD